MRAKSELLKFIRLVEVVGAAAILGLGFWIWLHLSLKDFAIYRTAPDADITPTQLILIVLLMFFVWVVPGVIVMIGAYLQTMRSKRWALALVLIGGASVFPCVGYAAYFIFGYSADTSGLLAVYADLLAVTITIVVSVINAFFKQATLDTRTG